MLEAGASIDAAAQNDQHGHTALIVAAVNGRLEVVQTLLEAGTDIGIASHNGAI